MRSLGVVLGALVVLAAGSIATAARDVALSVSVTAVEASSNGATVRWQASGPAAVLVEWGVDERYGVWSRRTSAGRTGVGRSALFGLEPDTTYRYRVVARSRGERAETTGSFTTRAQPAWSGATFTSRALVVAGQPLFPRMVWKQCPWAYPQSLAGGVNVFMGTGCGNVEAQMSTLHGKAYAVLDVSHRGPEWRSLIGFHQLDEADEHVEKPEDLPLLPPSKASRRVTFLTLTNHFYSHSAPLPQGRGMYPGLIARAEMIGFDLYPLQVWCRRKALHDVFEAQRELVILAKGKPTFQWIEAGPMNQCGGLDPSAALVRAETWLAIAGGARGIGWFPDVWSPSIGAEISRLSAEIEALAPALLAEEGSATVSPADSPIRAGVRRLNGATYVIAVNSWLDAATAKIRVPGLATGAVRVWGENRTVPVRDGVLRDSIRGLRARIYVAPPPGA
jgi:hypothetical protein